MEPAEPSTLLAMSSAMSFQEYSWNSVGTSMPKSCSCCSVM